MTVKLYPDPPARRGLTVAIDVTVVLLVIVFAWVGWTTYQAVDRLTVLGEGVENAGTSIQDAFGTAADAVGGLPLVGDDLANGLTQGSENTGGRLVDLGQTGQDRVQQAAVTLGLLLFLLPLAFVAVIYGPLRWRQVRRLTAATRLFVGLDDPERRRLLAQRALFSLPPERLMRHTPDPVGDLAAGRFDALVAALLADAGLLEPQGLEATPTW